MLGIQMLAITSNSYEDIANSAYSSATWHGFELIPAPSVPSPPDPIGHPIASCWWASLTQCRSLLVKVSDTWLISIDLNGKHTYWKKKSLLISDTSKFFLLFFCVTSTSSKFLIPLLSAASNLDFSLRDYPQATAANQSTKKFISPERLLTNILSRKEIQMPSSLHSVWDNLEA